MSEVEKMYENAIGKVCTHTIINPAKCNHRRMARCCGCDWLGYPPFTAEKQLELIKWLASKQYAKYTTSLLINIRDTVRFSGGLIAGVCTLNVEYDKQDKDFENALAGLINEMWQDLTDQERTEIAEILRG